MIYGNIWQTDNIVIIDPKSGKVLSWINLTGLQEHLDNKKGIDVLNGIAYDEENDRIFVTGKLWPNLFEIALVPE
jgi:glutamine cyclotransferase